MEQDDPKLSTEDQARVDSVTTSGIHSVERKPFKPLRLLVMLVVVTGLMTGLSILIERLYID